MQLYKNSTFLFMAGKNISNTALIYKQTIAMQNAISSSLYSVRMPNQFMYISYSGNVNFCFILLYVSNSRNVLDTLVEEIQWFAFENLL